MFPYNDIEFRFSVDGKTPYCFLPEIIDLFIALFVIFTNFSVKKSVEKSFENDTFKR